MDKSPDAFRTISEAAEDLDLPQHVLRFWETRFPQIKPLKRGGGRRYYRPEDVALLRVIKQLLYGEGYTIKGVQRLVQGAGRAGGRFVETGRGRGFRRARRRRRAACPAGAGSPCRLAGGECGGASGRQTGPGGEPASGPLRSRSPGASGGARRYRRRRAASVAGAGELSASSSSHSDPRP